jgi:DNA-binding NarL/FixJ family response regulator
MLPHAAGGLASGGNAIPVSVCLAEAAPVYREGLMSAFDRSRRITVDSCCSDGEDLLASARDIRYPVYCISTELPPAGGLQAVRGLRRNGVEACVVLYGDWHECVHVLSACRLGVLGMIDRNDACEEFVRAVMQASAGRSYLSPGVQVQLNRAWSQRRRDGMDELTPTEFQVLSLLSGNLTSSKIADTLCISVRTVEKHRQNIGKKLNLRGCNALLSYAVNNARCLSAAGYTDEAMHWTGRGANALYRRVQGILQH